MGIRAGNRVDLVAEDPPGGQLLDVMPIECDEPDIGALGSAARKAQKRGRRVSDAAKVKPKLLLFSLGARKDAGCCQHAGADNLAHDRIIHGAHRRGSAPADGSRRTDGLQTRR